MSTASKLWLGFGLLLVLLIGTGLFVAHRLASIERSLLTIMAVQEPATAVTYEMAANVITTGAAVIRYLDTGDSTSRALVAQDHVDFERLKARYDRVARSPGSRQLGKQIGEAHGRYRVAGDSLMYLGDHLHGRFDAFSREALQLDGMLADGLRARLDGRGRDGQEKRAEATLLEASAAGIGASVGRYLRDPAAIHRVHVADLERTFRATFARLGELHLSDEEQSIAVQVDTRFEAFSGAAREVLATSDLRRDALAEFTRLGRDLEQLVGEGTRSLARIDLIEAHRSAGRAIRTSLIAVLVLLVAGILIGGSTALSTARSVVRTDQALRDRMDELSIADRRKDEFLGVLSHELRNPLAPLGNALGVLEGYADQVPEPVRKSHAMMKRQVRDMTRLVDDLLDVNRIQHGKIALRLQPVDLTALVLEVVSDLRPSVEARGHRIDVTRPPGETLVDADHTRLAQIVANLLNNAVKYTPDGGHITLAVDRTDDQAILRVQDTGIGISHGMLARIFEPFTQANPPPDGSRGGLGIGLALVGRLVELHGGSVQARSDGLGKGSTFVVTLPRLPAGVSAKPAREEARQPSPCSRRILVVDDNHDSADTLASLLTLWGHRTHVAYDGVAALAAVSEFRPEIVLLDIHLPGMDGYEVARRMRDGAAPAEMRLVAVTGFGLQTDVARAYEAGFDHHLTKPVNAEALRSLLDHAGAAPADGQAPAPAQRTAESTGSSDPGART